MQLSFQSPYLSIQSFPDVNVPSFTVITGVNGSGKTHLLKAIAAGNIKSDIAQAPAQEAKCFDWSSLVPNDIGNYQVSDIYGDREQILQLGQNERQNLREPLFAWAYKHNIIKPGKGTTRELLRMTQEELGVLVEDDSRVEEIWNEKEGLVRNAVGSLKANSKKDAHIAAKLNEFEGRLGSGILALTVQDFADIPFGWGQTDVFRQSFAQLFTTYFELQKQNLLRRITEAEGRTPSAPSMTDGEFYSQYGEEPWHFVNRILVQAHLDFEIDYPVDFSTTRFTPTLRKISSGVELQFSELSSGERILMSFAFCLYYSQDNRQVLQRPKLLLLDEVDAPLHPSMSRQLVQTIQGSLVRDQKIHVVLATHSPSTVAVTPDDSVYVMHIEGAGLSKANKRQAIAVLTSEIPTLSIDYSGRRQVFVESRYDAERFEKLYRFLSSHISSERSLAFVAVGRNKNSGDEGGGSENVKRIVRELSKYGNESVFGVVDWDLVNKPEKRIFVLAHGTRYSVENCLLDPLLVAALSIRTDANWAKKMGLIEGNLSYFDLRDKSNEELQGFANFVVKRVLDCEDIDSRADLKCVEYFGGNSLVLPSEYLRMKGHELEEKIYQSMPVLKRYHRQGELLLNLIDPVIREIHKFTPIELVQLFNGVLNFEDDNE